MYKSKKFILENLLLKQGKKWKSENIIKKTFKKLQITENKKKSLNLFKNALVLCADAFSINKQTLKKGKRKKTIQTTVFLTSEKSRFSNSWKKLGKSIEFQKVCPFSVKLTQQIQKFNSLNLFLKKNEVRSSINEKSGFKFRW